MIRKFSTLNRCRRNMIQNLTKKKKILTTAYDGTMANIVEEAKPSKPESLYNLENSKWVLISYFNDATNKNITIHFVEESLKTNHHDFHKIKLGLTYSEYESDTISKRVNATNILLKNKGWKFGRVPYGKQVQFNNGIKSSNEIIK